jgi:hypothetical protein
MEVTSMGLMENILKQFRKPTGKFTLHLPEEFRAFLKDAGYFQIKIEVFESNNWIAAIEKKA